MGEKKDYLMVLAALYDIPFSVGKRLLMDYLKGNADNDSIDRNMLYKKK